MTKYVKLIDGNLYLAPKNKDGVCNYNLYVENLIRDGYKPLLEIDKLPGYLYNIRYIENEDNIAECVEIVKSAEELEQERLLNSFFQTSLGYISRDVHMKNGNIKDFLTDILPILQEGDPIVTYNVDGSKNENVSVTKEFLQECREQLHKDFYGAIVDNPE